MPYILQTQAILMERAFRYGRFRTRNIIERGKKRHLCYSQTYPDRIIQHAVLQVVSPIILGTCTSDTFAALEGRGTHRCSMKVRGYIYSHPEARFYLKMDVHHYFQSVDRNVLFDLIKRKIKDRDTLEVLRTMIFDAPGDRDLPIGLYSSQIFSTYYLSYFDHWVKEVLPVLLDNNDMAYFRYMDDLVLISKSKDDLHKARKLIETYLKEELHLKLKGNWHVGMIRDGLDFVGYVHFPDHVRIRKRNKVQMKRVASSIVRCSASGFVPSRKVHAFTSYLGMVQWCDGLRLAFINKNRVAIAMEFGST